MSTQLLCFGHDEMLLSTRQWLLEKYADVKLVRKLSQLSALIQSQSWDIAILCHTLEVEERRRAIELLTAKCPKSKIICLMPISAPQAPDLLDEACIPTEGSAYALLSVVEKLLASSRLVSSPQSLTVYDAFRDGIASEFGCGSHA